MLFLPALKLIHLLLVLILLLDHSTFLLLLTICSSFGSSFSLLLQFLLGKIKLFVVKHNLVEPVPGLLSNALLLYIVLHSVIVVHKGGQLLHQTSILIVVHDDHQVCEHL